MDPLIPQNQVIIIDNLTKQNDQLMIQMQAQVKFLQEICKYNNKKLTKKEREMLCELIRVYYTCWPDAKQSLSQTKRTYLPSNEVGRQLTQADYRMLEDFVRNTYKQPAYKELLADYIKMNDFNNKLAMSFVVGVEAIIQAKEHDQI